MGPLSPSSALAFKNKLFRYWFHSPFYHLGLFILNFLFILSAPVFFKYVRYNCYNLTSYRIVQIVWKVLMLLNQRIEHQFK
jgi:hypothetical protein